MRWALLTLRDTKRIAFNYKPLIISKLYLNVKAVDIWLVENIRIPTKYLLLDFILFYQ
ncbi:hypothetical protein Cylst_3342 [Cylindrospermum stagnale PCC 7417]|uniref:Uncharacterized protein n=1 Tax=Cylindrospermum stagnale PCC 7417 TaxID=56107 RepID=K9X097_9NOST|nr:hypothetical protein Cylst_3342 [Cylindrospermum stagnale PCC 7417]